MRPHRKTLPTQAKHIVIKCGLVRRNPSVRFSRGIRTGRAGKISILHSLADQFGMKQLNAGGFVPNPTSGIDDPRIHVRRMSGSSGRIECCQFAVPAPTFETGQFKRGCEPRIRRLRQGGIVLCK